MSKRIIGVTYEDGICTGITVDGILDDKTTPEDVVQFKRVLYGQWLPDVKFGTDVMAGNTIWMAFSTAESMERSGRNPVIALIVGRQ